MQADPVTTLSQLISESCSKLTCPDHCVLPKLQNTLMTVMNTWHGWYTCFCSLREVYAVAHCLTFILAGRDLFLWLRITALPWGIRVTLVCAPISLLVRIFGDTIILLTSQLPVLVNLHSSWFLQYLWCILLFCLVVLLIHQPPDKKSWTTNT